jgi:hypothetical protein
MLLPVDSVLLVLEMLVVELVRSVLERSYEALSACIVQDHLPLPVRIVNLIGRDSKDFLRTSSLCCGILTRSVAVWASGKES